MVAAQVGGCRKKVQEEGRRRPDSETDTERLCGEGAGGNGEG